jgi:hypothetical protein
VVVEVDGHILSKERVEGIICQSVRVAARRPKDHQIRHIDNTNAEVWKLCSEDIRSSDDLEGQFSTNAEKNDVRIQTIICGGRPSY